MDKRTYNRIHEHKDHTLTKIEERSNLTILKGQDGTLLKCSCSWFGWLPTESLQFLKISS